MIDRKWIGSPLRISMLPIERSRLRFFAKAIGETNPIYSEQSVARDAGYPDLPAPPTFLFAAEMDSGAIDDLLARLQVPIDRVLHGEQGFVYHKPVCVGDTVTVESHVDEIYDKKNGALEFVVKSSRCINQHGELVAEMRSVLVVRR